LAAIDGKGKIAAQLMAIQVFHVQFSNETLSGVRVDVLNIP